MFQEYLAVIAQGIPTSLLLTVVSLFIAFFLALGLTFLLSIGNKLVKSAVNLFLVLFTGTPLLVQFFLIYAGPGQFKWLVDSPLWGLFSNAWFCAALALALNSAAYSTQLFHGAVKAISKGQWESCAALGLSRLQTLKILIPYALKRALPSYTNEIILVFKGTALASTIRSWISWDMHVNFTVLNMMRSLSTVLLVVFISSFRYCYFITPSVRK